MGNSLENWTSITLNLLLDYQAKIIIRHVFFGI